MEPIIRDLRFLSQNIPRQCYGKSEKTWFDSVLNEMQEPDREHEAARNLSWVAFVDCDVSPGVYSPVQCSVVPLVWDSVEVHLLLPTRTRLELTSSLFFQTTRTT